MEHQWRNNGMNTTTNYMTIAECLLYRELAAKHGEPALFAMSLPCSLPSKAKTTSAKTKQKPKKTVRRKLP